MNENKPKTLYQKIYDAHVVRKVKGETPLLYIDRHLVHEVTSPQAFDGLRVAERALRQPGKTFAVMDHNTSTTSPEIDDCPEAARIQLKELVKNCAEFKVRLYDSKSENNGIVHVAGPELGITLPGTTIVCGDSHTATHGAFGALAFGIGTSEVEHVMATQSLPQSYAKTMLINVEGRLNDGVFAKDLILAIIGKLGHGGGTGYVVEFSGPGVSALSMEGRMTLCNMAIEMGAKAGMIAPDEITFDYIKGRPFAPKGSAWDEALNYWRTLKSDEGASYDAVVTIDAGDIKPQLTWGTNPGQVMDIDAPVPDPVKIEDMTEREQAERALRYMGIKPGDRAADIKIDAVFIGSCTNGRIEDLRAAAAMVKGGRVAPGVRALVVPGSYPVRKQAEEEGLAQIFKDAGFEWRLPGCSMCLAMNEDKLEPFERCASTSNRNFEGRQGRDSRTHLVSPAMAAAAALNGCFVDIREMKG